MQLLQVPASTCFYCQSDAECVRIMRAKKRDMDIVNALAETS